MLKIRRYQASDHNEVWNLHNLALDQVGANAGSGAQDNDLHTIEETYLSNKGEFLAGILRKKIGSNRCFAANFR